jgi:class 3 adenylate cyclase
MRRPVILLLFLLGFQFTLKAQNEELDSLWSVWNDISLPDSSRIDAMNDLAWSGYLFSKPDSAFECAKLAYNLAKKAGFEKKMASSLNTQGASYWVRGNHVNALYYFNAGYEVYQKTGDLANSAACLNNMGIIYRSQGNNLKALNFLLKSLNIRETLKDSAQLPGVMSNVGLIYQDQEDYNNALKYYRRSLKIREILNDSNRMAGSLTNIGLILQIQEDYDGALNNFEKSLTLNRGLNNRKEEANSLVNIGLVYVAQDKNEKALDYLEQSNKICIAISDSNGMANVQASIGAIYLSQNKFPKAISRCKKGLEISDLIGDILIQKEACNCLYLSYKENGDPANALHIHERLSVITDSLKQSETQQKLHEMEFNKLVLQDSIANAEKDRIKEEQHQAVVSANNRSKNISFGVSVAILILAAGLYSRLRYVRKTKSIIEQEKDRSESLLLNILPIEIAKELKEKGKADARDFETVSILFSDFKGFTEQSAKLSAADLVDEINYCFEGFDQIMDKYQVEKIKTIGDAYMAAGGLPIPTHDSVKNTVLAAIEMQTFIQKRKSDLDTAGKPSFEMRVGIHTGPVVAGIVGVKKFQYDLWGDTVNTASRMESLGEVGRVNISQATYELLKNEPGITFKSRGKIKVKGKGEMQMWFVSQS